jgi:hypothetical protein
VKFALFLLVWMCAACSPKPDAKAVFELRAVAKAHIAALEKDPATKTATLTEPAPEVRERVRGMVLDRANATNKMRALVLVDAKALGDAAVPVADAIVDEADRSGAEKLSAIETLGAIDTLASAEALLRRVEKGAEPWIRAQAAFQLSNSHEDSILPRLLLRLKYEMDGDTVIWTAAALASRANYAGLDGLRVLAASGKTAEVRQSALDMLAQLAKDAGFPNGNALYDAWYGVTGDAQLPRREPSPRLQLDLWKRIETLAVYDLRQVDDSRFILVRIPSWSVGALIEALHEDDAHVRVHVAQCLARMNARATAACDALVSALDEPHMASTAASALGDIGCAGAFDALVARTLPKNDPEMRNAATAALGRLGSKNAIEPLTTLLGSKEPLDLRQTAAEALLTLDRAESALPLLSDCLTRPGADNAAAETAIESWLARRAPVNDAATIATLTRWREIAGPSTDTPPPEVAVAHRKARKELIDSALRDLLSASK